MRFGCCPASIGEVELDNTQQIKQTNDEYQRRVFKQADKCVHDARYHELEGLRQNNKPCGFPISHAKRSARFILALGYGLQTPAHHLAI